MLPVMKLLALAAIVLTSGPFLALAQTSGATASTAAQGAPAPKAKSWLVRTIPPRPTFDKDMSPSEQKLMEDHYAYWKSRFEEGVCVFGGPVFDPKGVYGVLAVRAANEDEARAIAAADPSVKAGLNRIEVAEMVIAFLPSARTHP